ncbi:UNVERIFIED_CONTAM: Germin-like protein 1-1 [Sesamum calycinum]|uniref:Germin-like protein 1-1 n=1 Tax=Sesamum calycinum TaxID=2727403 RepID=A0AAW2R8C1_9LAMI
MGSGVMEVVVLLGTVVMMMLCCCSRVSADPDMLQDVCVADLISGVKVNGFACKSNFTAEDFFFAGIAKPGATNTSTAHSSPAPT